jgi:hypothetical protein
MSAEVESHVSKQLVQLLTIAAQFYRLQQAKQQQQNQDAIQRWNEYKEASIKWLSATNGVGKLQCELLLNNDTIKQASNVQDYKNLFAFASVQSANEHISQEDRQYYQNAGIAFLREAQERFDVDLKEELDKNAPELAVRDLRNPKDVQLVNIIDDLKIYDRFTASNWSDELQGEYDHLAQKQPTSVYGLGTDQILTNTNMRNATPTNKVQVPLNVQQKTPTVKR